MTNKTVLRGVSETLLITLFAHAKESRRPDALLNDKKAVDIVKGLGMDASPFKLQGHDEVALIMRVRKFDHHVQEFLKFSPDAVVVHIRCGLDMRFDRVDNLESWGDGIRLLDEWFYFDDPEPRMQPYRWMRFFPLFGKSTGIFHYKLRARL